jgi:hypothetical protein
MDLAERVARLETTQEHHTEKIGDIETRMRAVEVFKAQALAYGTVGATIGGTVTAIVIKVFF